MKKGIKICSIVCIVMEGNKIEISVGVKKVSRCIEQIERSNWVNTRNQRQDLVFLKLRLLVRREDIEFGMLFVRGIC